MTIRIPQAISRVAVQSESGRRKFIEPRALPISLASSVLTFSYGAITTFLSVYAKTIVFGYICELLHYGVRFDDCITIDSDLRHVHVIARLDDESTVSSVKYFSLSNGYCVHSLLVDQLFQAVQIGKNCSSDNCYNPYCRYPSDRLAI